MLAAIEGMTLTSALGRGNEAQARALRCGESGLRPLDDPAIALDAFVGAVDDMNPLPEPFSRFECRNNRLAWLGLQQDGFLERVARARERFGAARVGLFIGTSTSGLAHTEDAFDRWHADGTFPPDYDYFATQNTFSCAAFVRAALGLEGFASVTSTACSSSAKVVAAACRALRVGLCDAAVVGGVDTLCRTTLFGFNALQLLDAQPCRPFAADRRGISIGESAGFLLLQAPERASDDDLFVLGFGESSDAHHMSSPHPEGLGAREAMQAALAGHEGSVDYINLHGTGTEANDAAEDAVVADLAPGVPCSSTKGWTGHTLGACGITELVLSASCIRDGFLPGTANTQSLDEGMRAAHLLQGREQSVHRVLSNSYGFGGSNCALLVGRA